MTLERLAGRLFWCGWGDGDPTARAYSDHARWLVEELGAGGIILFTRNLGTPKEIAALTAELSAGAPGPLLIGVDQEGGRVSRLALPGMVFPGNMALGHLDDLETTRAVSRAIGEQLAALGFNADFAPVLDVNNNPANPVIGVRSFGEEPKVVARHGVASLSGFRDAGILPVVKHFPGHGDTSVDSHLALPVQPAGRERVDQVELAPFRAAIAAGAPAVMTAHIRFPALDPKLPATLSRSVLTGLLREQLGFEGLIVTDCLEMRGIADGWSPEETAVLALQAGADLLLVCHTRETQARMHRAVCDAVRAGVLPEDRLRRSAARLDETLAALAVHPSRGPVVVGSEAYRELEARTALAALAPLDGRGAPCWSRRVPVLVSGAAAAAVERFAEALRHEGFEARSLPRSAPADGGRALEALSGARQALWLMAAGGPAAGTDADPQLLARLLPTDSSREGVVIVAAGEPYGLERYPADLVRLRAWGAQPVHAAAVARWIARDSAPRGG